MDNGNIVFEPHDLVIARIYRGKYGEYVEPNEIESGKAFVVQHLGVLWPVFARNSDTNRQQYH